jgi:hypothetical protein
VTKKKEKTFNPDFLQRLDGPIHGFFELSYAQYLTIPRSVLQSMPVEWQERFVKCLEELDDAFDWRPRRGKCYRVMLCEVKEDYSEDGESSEWGRTIPDDLEEYRHRRVFETRDVRKAER